jgi:LysR family transcriptional regulator, glycine cleavage system transcriptional activator
LDAVSCRLKVRRPPLADLHAFEAAARHLSFTRAAAELGVTQGAVSQRIRRLEDRLGRPLFERLTRALALTADGKTLAAAIGDGLARIDDGLAAIDRQRWPARGAATLTLSVAPGFACRWLLPRLGRFHERHPGIEVRIEAEDRLANFTSDGVDLAIRCGLGAYPGLRAELLTADAVFPVCNAALAERGLPLAEPEDLLGHVLLHDSRTEQDGGGCTWQDWFRSAGVRVQRLDGPRVSNAHLAIEAAINGLGVALARATLVNDDLAEGRLVRPLRHAMPTPFSYHLVHSPKADAGSHLAAFVEWLRAEVAAWRSTACASPLSSGASH